MTKRVNKLLSEWKSPARVAKELTGSENQIVFCKYHFNALEWKRCKMVKESTLIKEWTLIKWPKKNQFIGQEILKKGQDFLSRFNKVWWK